MVNPDENGYHMWRFWKEKYGEEDALKLYYPKTVAANHDLQLALFQIKSATALINQIMEKNHDDNDTDT